MLKGKDKVIKKINEVVERQNTVLKSLYLNMYQNIVAKTPVKDGFARNSWYITTGSPTSEDGRDKSESGSASLAELSELPTIVVNKTVWFTNPLPYAVDLENGSSTQARRGFVRQQALTFKRDLKKRRNT